MLGTAQKRKKPPTFQHFPVSRAKKLKKAWVAKAKIRSKWTAQKRREGISSLHSAVPPQEREDEIQDIGRGDGDDKGGENLEHSDSDIASTASLDEGSQPGDDEDSESEVVVHSPSLPPPPLTREPKDLPPRRKYDQTDNKKRPLPHYKNSRPATTAPDDQSSLRDLFQKAYSKTSLHTYKSDPLKKRRGEKIRGRGGRGGNAASASMRGRGQPNMKLRMSAMLEKIKRDYS